MAGEVDEGSWTDPVPRQVTMAGAGELHVLHFDSGLAQGGYQATRLLDRHHVILISVNNQKRGRAPIDPGQRRGVAVTIRRLLNYPAQEGDDLVQLRWLGISCEVDVARQVDDTRDAAGIARHGSGDVA